MALTPLEALNKVVEDRVARADTLAGMARTLSRFYTLNLMGEKRDTSINWDVDMGGEDVGIGAVNSVTTNTAGGDTVPASLRIGRYRIFHRFDISKIACTEAATLAPADLVDLLGNTVTRGIRAIMKRTNKLIYTGAGTTGDAEFNGLAVIGDPLATYAGISPATYPLWKPVILANGNTPRELTEDLLLDVDEAVSLNNITYNAITCHPTTAKKYNKLFITETGGHIIAPETDPEVPGVPRVELGQGKRFYNGIPIDEDPDCPVGQMVFWDTPNITMYSFRMVEGNQELSQQEDDIVTANTYGLVLHMAELPSPNSTIRTFEMYIMPQLRYFNRRRLLILDDLA
jgi:hypothetical protein